MKITIVKNEALNWNVEGTDLIIQNVKNLALTKKGEIPFMRGVGIDPDLLDAALDKQRLIQEIRECIEEHEARVEVGNIDIHINEEGNAIIDMELEVKNEY